MKPRIVEARKPARLATAFVAVLWLWFVLLMAWFILFVGYHW
jgi:hypothetical protein